VCNRTLDRAGRGNDPAARLDRAVETRECADEDCAERLELTRDEYENVRSDPTWFAVAHTTRTPRSKR